MITLKEAFIKANERQIKYLDAIQNKPKHNIFRIASSLRADHVSKFLYYYFEENNIVKAKLKSALFSLGISLSTPFTFIITL